MHNEDKKSKKSFRDKPDDGLDLENSDESSEHQASKKPEPKSKKIAEKSHSLSKKRVISPSDSS